MPTLTQIQSTYVNEKFPKANYSTRGTVAVRQASGDRVYGLYKFTPPAPAGATYLSAKFQVRASAAIPSRQYRIRLLTKSFDVAKVTWDRGMPGNTTTGEVTVTATLAKNGMLEFDVTGLMNRISTGGVKWYGFLLYMVTSDGTARHFHSQRGSAAYGPRLVYEYTTAPRQPSGLNPSGGRVVSLTKPVLSANFTDTSGATNLTGLLVNVYTSATATTPSWTSGVVDTNESQLDLSTTDFPAIAEGASRWWEIQYRDGDNLWSPMSDRVQFTRRAKGAVTILNPSPEPDNFVEEPTPPIIFETSGMTQRNVQIVVLNANKTAKVYDSGKMTTAEKSVDVGAAAAFVPDAEYVVQVLVWDTYDRATSPGDLAYVMAERKFRFQRTTGVSPVPSLTIESIGYTPANAIGWSRAAAPDFFDIYRSGELIAKSLEPEDVRIGTGRYAYVDMLAPPNDSTVEYEVMARVNGRSSANNAKVKHVNRPITAYLSTIDGDIVLPLLNYSAGITQDDGSSVVQVLNSSEAITVYQGLLGRQGSFEGILSGAVPGPEGQEMTARQYLNQFLELRDPKNNGRPCVLTYADRSIPCVVSKMDYSPVIYNEEIAYVAEFYITARKQPLR